MKADLYDEVEHVSLIHPEYNPNLYMFICEVLMTAEDIVNPTNRKRGYNLNGRQVYMAFCSMLLHRYGFLSLPTLKFWGVNNAGDIGRALSYLEKEGTLVVNKDENLEDFSDFPPLEVMLQSPFHVPSMQGNDNNG